MSGSAGYNPGNGVSAGAGVNITGSPSFGGAGTTPDASSSGPSSGSNGLGLTMGDSAGSAPDAGPGEFRDINLTLGLGGVYTGIIEHTYSGPNHWFGKDLRFHEQSWGGNGGAGARRIARGISSGARYAGGALFGGQMVVSGLMIAQTPNFDTITQESFNTGAGYIALRGGLPGFLFGTGYFLIGSTIGWEAFLDPLAPVYVRGSDIHGARK